MTLAQIAEKPITVATDEAINSFADTRRGRCATPVRRPNSIRFAPGYLGCTLLIAVSLNDDNHASIS
jgi:hypothetical protein